MIPTKLEDWFYHPAVQLRFDKMYRGYLSIGSPRIEIGGKVLYDSEPEVNTVAHEMGHLIEIEDHRAADFQHGLNPGKWVNFPGHPSGGWHETVTSRAEHRELEVMAIQATIEEHLGFTFDYEDAGSLFKYLPGILWFRGELGLEYEHEQDGTLWTVIGGMIKSRREEMDIEPIWEEWQRKQELVSEQLPVILKNQEEDLKTYRAEELQVFRVGTRRDKRYADLGQVEAYNQDDARLKWCRLADLPMAEAKTLYATEARYAKKELKAA